VIWELRNVSLRGSGGKRLSGVTLGIGEGTTAVVGCSGAGKSSLLNLLVGLEEPDSGTVEFRAPGGSAPLPLFWVPQEGGLWPHMTAKEHLETVAPPGDAARMSRLLDAFDIADKVTSHPDEMSLGEQSRLAVARALASRAAVLVMDEPLSSVDEARRSRYWDAIRRQVSETGASLVFATHSPKAVLREAATAVCVKDGRVVHSGDVDDLYHRPGTRELMDCLGEGNWLEPEESRAWLGREEGSPRCYRPEQVSVERTEGGPFVVRESSFQGSVARVELEHEESREVKRFFHRPASNSLHAGVRVVLKALLVLLVVLGVSCGESDEPVLPVEEIRAWMLPPDGTRIPAPRALAVGPCDELFVLDTAGRILVHDAERDLVRSWRMPEAETGRPEGVLVLDDGTVVVADTHYHRVVVFDGSGTELRRFGREGRADGEFIYPVALARDDAGNLYVCEYGSNDRVQKFSPGGEHLVSFGGFGTGEGQFQRPSGVVWHGGKVYVADAVNNRVQVFTDGGEFVGVLGGVLAGALGEPDGRPSLSFPYDMKLGGDGALYVVEYRAGRVTKLSTAGKILGRFGSSGTGDGRFSTPWGIAVDSRGRIIVADTGNRRLVELGP
jgi:ABC-type multidrug transport system ATPase subunit/DNA-binding beta-propeller fold protein YncE